MTSATANEPYLDVTAASVTIYIDGLPHLILRRSELLAFDCWIEAKSSCRKEPRYFLEIIMRGDRILCDYDSRDVWSSLISAIAAACIFDKQPGE